MVGGGAVIGPSLAVPDVRYATDSLVARDGATIRATQVGAEWRFRSTHGDTVLPLLAVG